MLQNQRSRAGTPLLIFFVFSIFSLSASTIVSAAEVYKWVDENGVVTYSQQKPKHTDSSTVRTRGAPPSAGQAQLQASSAQTPPGTELSAEQQQILTELELEEADRVVEETARKASNCALFTKLLTQLTVKDRVRAREPDGSERMVPEEERQEKISEARREIKLNCI